jgi:FMN phosphatase YigB (HAD superfamily)
MINQKIAELFKESKKINFNIFQDLDGCLVDWDNGYKNKVLTDFPEYLSKYNLSPGEFKKLSPKQFEEEILLNYYLHKFPEKPKAAKSAAKGAFWKPIQGDASFWKNLNWKSDGKVLIETLKGLKDTNVINELNILSSPSSDPVCEPAKRQWLMDNGISSFFDRILIFNNKSQFAEGNKFNILIDDTEKKIDGWVAAGGTGILHKDTRSTLNELKGILK